MRSWRLCLVLGALVVGMAGEASAQNGSVPGGKTVNPAKLARGAQKIRPSRPDFGVVQEHYVRVGGSEFVPDGSSMAAYTNTWSPGVNNFWLGYFQGPAYQHVYAWVHAPGGTILSYVEMDYCNTDPTHALIMNIYACDFTGECGAAPIAVLTGAANSLCDSAGTDGVVLAPVDNFFGEYLLEVVFPSGGPTDGSIGLAGAIVGWKYQVSPAPAVATFPDVPISDPGFQYIEALVASGITAGCGGGNYCPDNPLTRRQMAIFLSKALGLNWDGY